MAQKIYGIDFGTDTIKIYKKGQGIILIEKNVVSTVGKERRPVAIGEEAYEMFEKVPPSINVSFPLSHGVVSKIDDMIALWNFMGAKISRSKRMKGFQFYIAVPADITEVEKHAYSRIVSESDSKPKKVCLIDKPIADAYGLGLDVEKAKQAISIVELIANDPEVGAIYSGKVTRLMTFGAFVEIAPGKEGLVHISKLDTKRVEKVEDVVSLGDVVKVVCLGKDKMGRFSFSMKDVAE